MGLEIVTAGLNYNASKKASKAQQEGAAAASAVASDTADKQLALQREIWEKQQADQKDYLDQGKYGINTLGALMRPNADTSAILKNDPSYQFRLKQGQQSLDRSSAARGIGYSGAQMKAAQDYGQGMASTEFGNYYNRLAGLAQGGQQAANTLGGQGGQYASNASGTLGSLGGYLQNNLGQAANARASGYIGKANAINGGIESYNDNIYKMLGAISGGGFK
jgi:hypothetical protein